MKAVIILGALALVLVSGLEQNEEESKLLRAFRRSTPEGTRQREARDAEPGKKRSQKKKRTQMKKRNQKKKKSSKTKNSAKKDKKKAGRRRRRKNGAKKGRKPGAKRKGSVARQSTDCLADVVTAIKGYRNAGNQRRMANRIVTWKKGIAKKKDKAATQFEDAAESLDAATGGGKTCGSVALDSDTSAALAKLKSCSKTAAALCDDSTINDIGADGCKTKFEAYITAFDVSIYIRLNVVTYS